MADVNINTAVSPNAHKSNTSSMYWASPLIGYQFFVDSVNDLVYSKTTDGGASWGTKVTVHTGTVSCFDIWADRWTPNITGQKIHIAFLDSGSDDVRYASINPAASDALDGPRVVIAGAAFKLIADAWTERSCSITKARGGNLYIYWNGTGVGLTGMERSVDDGANWTSRATLTVLVLAGALTLVGFLCPANTSDPQDVAMIAWSGTGTTNVSGVVYDNSADTWGETTSGFAAIVQDTTYLSMSVGIRHSDGHLIVVYWTQVDNAAADLVCYDVTAETVGAGNLVITAKTDVITNENESGQCALMIDQNTGALYVAYLSNGTWGASAAIVYKVSRDGGATWGAETALSETTIDAREVWSDLSTSSGRWTSSWVNIDLDDIIVTAVNSVAITPIVTAWSPTCPPVIRLVEGMVPSGTIR